MKVLKTNEFKDLVKGAINCLATRDCIKYRLSSGEVLMDFGNEQYRLKEKEDE